MVARFPYVGVYLWTWISILNPHRFIYGIGKGQSFNFWIAAITIAFWLFSKERKIPATKGFAAMVGIFALWTTLTTMFSPTPNVSWPLWDRNIKILVLVYIVLCTIVTRVRLHTFLWVYVLCIGFWGANSGLATIATGARAVIEGPVKSMLYDRNHLALAMTMSIPLMNYLRIQSTNKLLKWALLGLMAVTAAGVIGTYSRGGLISLSAMGAFLWWKSKNKIVYAILAGVVVSIVIGNLPDRYVNRASTLATVEEDRSFQGRVDAWTVAFETAMDRPLGAGFEGPQQPGNWYKYIPRQPRAAHSIYFMVIGEHGFIGFGLYMSMIATAWFVILSVARMARETQDKDYWGLQLCTALQCSIFTFLVGGAALSLSYYDGFLLVLSMGVLLRGIVKEDLARLGVQTETKKARHRLPTPHRPRPSLNPAE